MKGQAIQLLNRAKEIHSLKTRLLQNILRDTGVVLTELLWRKYHSKMLMKESDCIPYKTEKIVRLRIGDPSAEFNSGCSIVEASFPASSSCKVI